MPVLPDFTALGERPVPQPDLNVSRVQPSSIKMAGIPGSLIEQGGGELQNAATIIDQTNLKMDTMAAEGAVNKSVALANQLALDPQTGFRNVQGEAATATDFAKGYTDKYNDGIKQISDGLANDQQRELFAQRTSIQQGMFQKELLGHVAQQQDNVFVDRFKGTRETSHSEIAAHPEDPIVFNLNMSRLEANNALMAQHRNLPQSMLDAMNGEDRSSAWSTRILAMNENDPAVAKQMAIDHADDLGKAAPKVMDEVDKAVRFTDARNATDYLWSQVSQDPRTAQGQMATTLQRAQDMAKAMYPDHPEVADQMDARLKGRFSLLQAGYAAQQSADKDTVLGAVIGPNGMPRKTTIDQALSSPEVKDAFNRLDPEAKIAINRWFTDAGGDGVQRSQATQDLRMRLQGMAINDPDGFANMPIEKLLPTLHQLPFADQDFIMGLRGRVATKEQTEQQRQENVLHALRLTSNIVPPPGPKEPEGSPKRIAYDQYTAALSQQIDQFKASTGKLPGDDDVQGMARNLATHVVVPGDGWFGTSSQKDAYELTPEQRQNPNLSFQWKDADKQTAIAKFTKRYGVAPTDAQLAAGKIAELFHANDNDYKRNVDMQIKADIARRKAPKTPPEPMDFSGGMGGG